MKINISDMYIKVVIFLTVTVKNFKINKYIKKQTLSQSGTTGPISR